MNELPRSQDLIKPMLRVLSAAEGPISNSVIEEGVITELSIPDSLSSIIHSGKRTELQYRLAWARTKAKTSGLVESPSRKSWKITNKGRTQVE
jgi:restriction system protein